MEILDRPPTVAGLAIKLALVMHCDGNMQVAYQEPDSACLDACFVLAAWRDAVRLAGLPDDLGVEELVASNASEAIKA